MFKKSKRKKKTAEFEFELFLTMTILHLKLQTRKKGEKRIMLINPTRKDLRRLVKKYVLKGSPMDVKKLFDIIQ